MPEKIKHFFTIDVFAEKISRVLYVRNADCGHELHVSLRAGALPVTLPGSTEGIVQFVYEKPTGDKSDCQATITNNEAVFDLPRAAVDVNGDVKCEMRVYTTTAGTWYTTPVFIVNTAGVIYDAEAQAEIVSDPTVYESIVASETERRENEEARREAEAARAAAGYALESDVDAALALKSDAGHTHDDRYYTENEVDELLAAATGVDLREYAKKSELADVATSGSYNDLTNKPALLTQTAGTFTPTDQNADIAYAKVLQIGKAVFVSIFMELSAAVTTEASLVLGTLSGVGRPGGTLQYMLCGAKSSAGGVTWSECLCLIGTQNDYVNVSGFSSGDKQFLINAFYITD